MAATWHLFWVNLRRRWVSTVVLVVLIGLSLGICMASAIGARRTATAFPRFADRLAISDLMMYVGGPASEVADAIRDQPQVGTAGVGSGVGLMPRLPDGSPDFDNSLGAVVGDGVFGVAVDRPLLLDGRLPADDALREILLDERAAAIAGARVGDPFPALTFNINEIMEKAAEFEAAGREPTEEELAEVFTPVDLEVVGIGRTFDAILVNEATTEDGAALLSPAYGQEFPGAASYTVAQVELTDGASAGAYVSAVRAALPGIEIGPTERAARQASFAAAVGPYWLALMFFSLVLGVGSLLALGPAVMRVMDDELADRATLRALGAGRRLLVGSAALRPLAIGVTGSVIAIIVAVGLSSRFPVGPARLAESTGGVEIHAAGLLIGAVAVVAAVVCVSVLRGVVLTRSVPAHRPRPSAVVARASAAGLSPAALTGLHAAFAGGGAARRRWAGAGVVGALAMATAALGFGSGLTRLVDDPARFGWSWDVLIEKYDTPLDDELTSALRGDPDILGLVPISRGSVTLDGQPIPAIGMDIQSAGAVAPTILVGRAPSERGEIALGTVTARELDVGIGDRVEGTTGDGARLELELVGTAVVPSIQLDESNQLGQGALLIAADFERLAGWFPTAALADVREGTSLAALEERHFTSVLGVQRPGDITSYDGIGGVPHLLAVVLVALGLAVLVHLLVGSVRRRRVELAVLRSLGLRPRQVAATLLWQSSAQIVAVLVVAAPVGVIAARISWRWFADRIGIASDPSIPLVVVALSSVAVLAIANLVALPFARRAGSIHPARALRAE